MLDRYSGGVWMPMQRWLIAAAVTSVATACCNEMNPWIRQAFRCGNVK
jgi:hypothetical protein